ncbi:transcriptional regulator, DeoR family [Amycolatopsis marina]|uniref:Transcriptional regulator, DeoR family n=1 Tax=Amycolatopsis marina TaxID=490629 RepID=A0A1I0WM60_9PSEU|nr:DeoR/GlpR family DNA-binding transcription regulator [Amycolatopsis marina]SFA89644.1 transcriptional regulator, DeoR family [Amycolatopsis marina]
MDRHERLTAVLDMLSDQDSITVDDVVEKLGASPATVRRDLDHLAKQQLLTRTRGGAVAASVSYDLPLRYKASRQAPEKERIAQVVAGLIRPGSTIGLNGGTTTTNIARAIALHEAFQTDGSQPGVTVVTNALNIASELAVRPQVKVVVVGGVVRTHSYEIIGPLAERMLEGLSVGMAVIGVDAISPEFGAMAFDEREAATNALLAAHAERVVVAADSSKLDQRAFARIVPVSALDVLVTDVDADARVVERFRETGVEVFQA